MTKQELNMTLNSVIHDLFPSSEEAALRRSSEALRRRYRDKESKPEELAVKSAAEAEGYLAWRYPVTAMVIAEVLDRLVEVEPGFRPDRILDLGAGPAVSVLPLSDRFPEAGEICLVEEQAPMRQAGDTLLKGLGRLIPQSLGLTWLRESFLTASLPKADLVLASYALNELSEEEISGLCRKLEECAKDMVLLIVPGTPEHFRGLLMARSLLLQAGFGILAPCTFSGGCPMANGTDWCHFSQRIQRSALLRRLKGGELAWEDEKFSYLIAARGAGGEAKPHLARILRHPQIHKGRREVTLCQEQGITTLSITKGKHPAMYRDLKDKGWGDRLELPWPEGEEK